MAKSKKRTPNHYLKKLLKKGKKKYALAHEFSYEIGKALIEKNVTYKELGISRRNAGYCKAFYRIVERTNSLHLVRRIEIGKLILFDAFLRTENIEVFVDVCEQHSVRELRVIAKAFPPLAILNRKKAPQHREKNET